MFFVYTTIPEKHAKEIANKLIKRKLAACINLMPVTSIYPWKEGIEEDAEFGMLVKTTKKEELTQWLQEQHPYDVPCIAHWKGNMNTTYEEWMKEVTE